MTAVQQLPEFLLAVSCPTLVLVLPCYCNAILYRWISLSCTQAVSQHVPSCSSSLSVSLGPEVLVWPGLSALWPGLQHLTGSWHPWPNCGPLPASVSCTLPSERYWRSAGPDASYWWAQPSLYSTTSECLRSERNIYTLIKFSAGMEKIKLTFSATFHCIDLNQVFQVLQKRTDIWNQVAETDSNKANTTSVLLEACRVGSISSTLLIRFLNESPTVCRQKC